MSLPSFSLEGQVAVVTGGKQGIGRAIALTFAEAGADVILCDFIVEDGKLEEVAEEINKLGQRALTVQADVSVKKDIEDLARRATAELGPVDILVNNAGISSDTPLLSVEEEEWDRVIDIHLKGCYLCCKTFAPGMVERKKGSIVSMASVEGIQCVRESANPYPGAKAGIMMLTRGLAWELGPHNVRVNAIAPGAIRTQMTSGMWDFNNPDFRANIEQLSGTGDTTTTQEDATLMLNQVLAQRIPMARMAEPEEIASAALFLVSDAASYITGHTLLVDGGLLA
ncbi:MAG TPA: SDR family oxidoreductase [Dehalococcoidia bacterium]|nr:SDR family oxidoreductase [Dehalococcoidia bacterium]